MSEKLNDQSPELKAEAEQLEAEREARNAELEKRLERAAERSSSEDLEEARHDALELAETEPLTKDTGAEVEPSEPVRPQRPTKRDLDASFNSSMNHIRKDMSPASRSFSKVIHNPVVEKVSNAVGNTVARPNLIIAGGLGTLIICSLVYLVAKRYGYVLSGFEAIGTFVLGWAIGAIVEFVRVGFINQRQR